MIQYWRNKSLMVSGSLVISLLLLIIVGTMSTISYQNSKADFFEQLEHLAGTLGRQMASQQELSAKAVEELQNGVSAAAKDTALAQLKRQYDAIAEDEWIGNAYLFSAQLLQRDGKYYLPMIQSNEELSAAGLAAGDEYEPIDNYLLLIEETLEKGYSKTAPYKDEYGNWISYLRLVKDDQGRNIGLFGIDLNYKNVAKHQKVLLVQSILTGMVMAAIALAVILFCVNLALRPLRRLAVLSKQASEGDLTVSIPLSSTNEVGQTAMAFNHMMSSIRSLVGNIQNTSTEVSRSSTELQLSAGQTAEASQEIAESIQQVAAGSDTQLQSTEECQTAMTEMSIGINRIAESSQIVADLASHTATKAGTGEAVMAKTVNQMQHIERELAGTVSNMYELKQLSGSIGEIMALIREVAGQTNLLALNASIEAARAGEAGKGFAVVAQEIRKLAERSRESSDQIDTILQGISTYTQQSVNSIEVSMKEAQTGLKISQEAGGTFREIVEAIRIVSEQVQEVSAASEEMSANSQEVAASLVELNRIASDASMNSTRVAASSEEQLASMEEISSLSEQLRGLASNLDEAINRFKV